MMIINMQLNDVQVQEGMDLLPPGDYRVTVSNSQVKEGSKGLYIQWEFRVNGKRNKLWDIMSLSNDIGRSRLKTLCMVTGHPNPDYLKDTEDLHGLECVVSVKIEKDATGQYPDKNKITSYKAIKMIELDIRPPIPQAPTAFPTPANIPSPEAIAATSKPTAAATKMPWER